MRRVLTGWLLMIILVAGCCPITSVNPLSPRPDAAYERRLSGIWQLESKHERVFLHLGKDAAGGWQVVVVEHKSDSTVEQESFGLTTSAIGSNHYLTLDLEKISRTHREGQHGHVILRYRLPNNYTLILERMNLDTVATAIQAGHLAGELQYDQTSIMDADDHSVQGTGKVECARITDSSAALADFVSGKWPDPLFVPHLSFKRVPCIPWD